MSFSLRMPTKTGIFKETMFYYALLFFAESATLYIYYYGWHWLQGGVKKWVHLTLGLLLNAVGTLLMFLANAWLTFMMSPAGVDSAGVFSGDTWAAIHNHLWNPINLHRFVANVAFGGSIVGAYAAFKFLSSTPTLNILTGRSGPLEGTTRKRRPRRSGPS